MYYAALEVYNNFTYFLTYYCIKIRAVELTR